MTGQPPPAAPPGVEIHTLISHDHVPRYLLALRSLLRFWPAPAPVAHDDGTLDGADRRRLAEAFPRLRVIDRDAADREVDTRLAGFPLIREIRAGNPRILQLVDYYLLAGSPRVIGMDSDVVFLRRPDEIMDWAARGGWVVGYSPESGWVPKGIHWLPDAVPGAPFIPDLCCGFVCVEVGGFLSPATLEGLMRRVPEDILRQPRFVTQMLFSLLTGALPAGDVHNLGERYRSGRLRWLPPVPDRVLCHYFGSHDDDDALAELLAAEPGLREVLGA